MSRRKATRPAPRSAKHAAENAPVLPDLLTQMQLADVLGVTTRQIRNLEARGLPIDESTGTKLYPKRQCQRWYIEFKQEEALGRAEREQTTDLEEAQRRKVLAEARLAEIKVLREEGRLVPLETVEAIHAETGDRLRAVLVNAPSNYAIHLERAGVEPAVAQEILEQLAEELIRALRGVADDLEADDGDTSDDDAAD